MTIIILIVLIKATKIIILIKMNMTFMKKSMMNLIMIQLLYNPPLLTEKHVTQWIIFGYFGIMTLFIFLMSSHCHSIYLLTELYLKASEHTKCPICQKGLTKAIRAQMENLNINLKQFILINLLLQE
ncbi:hypothetical protein C2G38_776873 [Gigaspora rosea]|uniref:Uncharacterized protein n=1 Tax=Gigaspora rosea TaxID=44941 RepID=A0A397W5I6_9GLOM|nr:hypothetical protein C2G38_776873 [Gigaspora rosea]